MGDQNDGVLRDCIEKRKSIRGFLPDLIPEGLIEKAIIRAQRAPSYKNTQPWEVVGVRGKRKEQLSALLLELLEKDTASDPDLPEPSEWPAGIDKRIIDTMKKRKAVLETAPGGSGDVPRQSSPKINNFRFYGAPVVLFIYQHRNLPLWSYLDAGMFIENLLLSFCEEGLGAVPQAFLADYPAQVKEFLGIPDDRRLLLGVSVGYPDTNHPLYGHYTERAPIEEIFRWST